MLWDLKPGIHVARTLLLPPTRFSWASVPLTTVCSFSWQQARRILLGREKKKKLGRKRGLCTLLSSGNVSLSVYSQRARIRFYVGGHWLSKKKKMIKCKNAEVFNLFSFIFQTMLQHTDKRLPDVM